jgi:polyisoprenoid-binding protein YceI
MRRLAVYALVLGVITSMLLTAMSSAAVNPCNPCNPCGAMQNGFTVDDERNVLTFESKAPLEKIVGTTSKITGKMKVDAKDITKDFMVMFEADLASMKTGIGLRDEHMRDNFLETGKYPKATLTVEKLTKVSGKQFIDQKPITVDAQGTLELHGVKKPIALKGVKVTYLKESEATKVKMPGDLLHIEGGFSIKLPDYNIKVPQMIVLKLDENIQTNVDLIATNAPPKATDAANPCNPCGGKKAENPCNPCGGKAGKKAENPCNPCGGKKK